VSVHQTPQARDEQTHTFYTYLMFGQEGDPLDKLSEADALWRNKYRVGLLKHLALGGLVKEIRMGPAQPTGIDLFGRPDVGIKFQVTARVHITQATALG
jgi:hypothetical protein